MRIVARDSCRPQSKIETSPSTIEAVLAALYLRGAPRTVEPPRRGWPQAVAALRRAGGSEPVAALREAGLTLPATILETPGLLLWAEEACESGAALTAVSDGYPARWLEAFGDGAPPALWRAGGRPPASAWIGAVGSREVGPDVLDFMAERTAEAIGLGHGIVSGGAVGCDTAAERAALAAGGPVLRLLPYGLSFRETEDGVTHLALAAPDEPFSRQLAMERNALIYAAAEATVVGHARFRQGGTWHGATEALRRRLGRLLVRADGSAAVRALCALGAEPLDDRGDLAALLERGEPQRGLFAYERKRGFAGEP